MNSRAEGVNADLLEMECHISKVPGGRGAGPFVRYAPRRLIYGLLHFLIHEHYCLENIHPYELSKSIPLTYYTV